MDGLGVAEDLELFRSRLQVQRDVLLIGDGLERVHAIRQ